MPPKKVEKKKARKNKRKSRTEVESSPSSSDSESVAFSPEPVVKDVTTQQPDSSSPSSLEPRKPTQTRGDTDTAYQTFYLQQATQEFANDLDKLRSAGDFHGEMSVGMLVRALREGTQCFSLEERGRVVGGG